VHERLRAAVEGAFSVRLTAVDPVDGGADVQATVWRATDDTGASYAVKLTRGGSVAGLLVPAHLAAVGVRGVPAPLLTAQGRPWADLAGARLSAVPWVEGRRGLDGGLDADGWRSLGVLLGAVHRCETPSEVRRALPVEDHRPAAAGEVLGVAARLAALPPDADELSIELRVLWRDAQPRVEALVEQTVDLGGRLRGRGAPQVICHNDPHLGNVVVDGAAQVWLLDWDDVVLAPRERDLVFVHDWVLGDTVVGPQERAWFFEGYGDVPVDAELLAYFTAVRAIEDLTWATQVLDARAGGQDRAFALRIVRWQLSASGMPATALRRLAQVEG
jgi:spectinomycin phosphotransferase